MTSVLTTAPLVRLGETKAGRYGGSKTFRAHLDFVIDGLSLYEMTDAQNYDLIGALGWAGFESDAATVRELLLDVSSAAAGARQPLFVCAECGDLGCGGITALVHRIEDVIVWRDFAFENDYDETMTDRDSFSQIGPFSFRAKQYRQALTDALFHGGG